MGNAEIKGLHDRVAGNTYLACEWAKERLTVAEHKLASSVLQAEIDAGNNLVDALAVAFAHVTIGRHSMRPEHRIEGT